MSVKWLSTEKYRKGRSLAIPHFWKVRRCASRWNPKNSLPMKIPNPHAAFMAFACALFAACSPQQPFITSPDGRIAVSVEADAGAGVTYAVTVDDKPLILPSAMGLAHAEPRCRERR